MAWDVIPESSSDVTAHAKSLAMSDSNKADAYNLWEFLRREYPDIPTPIAMGSGATTSKKREVKLMRIFGKAKPKGYGWGESPKGAKDLAEKAGVSSLKVTWGDGSRGNKGAGNQGNAFEEELVEQINLWIAGGLEDCTDSVIKEFIKQMTAVGTQDWFGNTDLKCEVMGGVDTKRPLTLVAGSWHVGGAGSGIGYDIGEKISDVTITGDLLGTVYISAKTSGTTNLINCGVRTSYFKPKDIKDRNINPTGTALLKTFGVNVDDFCDLFNDVNDAEQLAEDTGKPAVYPAARVVKAKASDFDSALLTSLIKGSLGHGFWYVHRHNKKIYHQWMTEKFLNESCVPDVSNITIEYGGKGDGAKRINILMETTHLELQFNIRNTSNTPSPNDDFRVYPTHLQAGYKFKKETKATWFHEAAGDGENTKRSSGKKNKLVKGKKNIKDAQG